MFSRLMEKAGNGWVVPLDSKNVSTKGGDRSYRQYFRAAIEQAASKSPTYPEFMEEMKKLNVSVKPNIASTGHISGVSYCYGEHGPLFKASKLGKAFGFKGVIDRGVEYLPERDVRFLREPYQHESTHAADRAQAAAEASVRRAIEAARAQMQAEAARAERVAAERAAEVKRQREAARLRQVEADRSAREEVAADWERAKRAAAARSNQSLQEMTGRGYIKSGDPAPAVLEAYKEVWNALKEGDDRAKDAAVARHLVSRGVSAVEITKVVAQESSVPDAVGAPKEAYAKVLVDKASYYEKAQMAVPEILLAYRKSERILPDSVDEPVPAVTAPRKDTIESYFGTGKPTPERPEGYQPPSLNIEVRFKKPEEPDQGPSR